MVNKFLALAYGLLWLLFILYAWSLSRRQARLKKEVDDLRSKVAEIGNASAKSQDAGD